MSDSDMFELNNLICKLNVNDDTAEDISNQRVKDLEKIKLVLSCLIAEERLDERCKDHALIGNYRGRRECHVEPDWLLVYKLESAEIIFERTGTHADLFK